MNRLWNYLVFFSRPGLVATALVLLVFVTGAGGQQGQAPWNAVGPAGGDARAFAAVPSQPNHLYMGTTNSWLYESLDRGASWHRL